METKSLLSMNSAEAKAFLLRQENYFTLPLPPYFNFRPILMASDLWLHYHELENCFTDVKPSALENVNYKMYVNKNGQYAWRPFQIIHPVLYADLVRCITSPSNWRHIKTRFRLSQLTPHIHCASEIVYSGQYATAQADIINNWWHDMEQASIARALDYKWLVITDITDCYGSLYTHAIPWALHGRAYAKAHRNDNNILGNKIDTKIRNMTNGQTCGIPQGSMLMDLIAEIVLAYVDVRLNNALLKEGIVDGYDVIRYRDDYRIFAIDSNLADTITKKLGEVLSEFSFKLSSEKTLKTSEIIKGSIKQDKLAWNEKRGALSYGINGQQCEATLQKHLLTIRDFSEQFQNSGSLRVALKDFYSDRILKLRKAPSDTEQLVSILSEIASKNPRVHAICSAVLSKLFVLMGDQADRLELTKRVIRKFSEIPNNAYLEVCTQRLTIKKMPEITYRSDICKAVCDKIPIWDSSWTMMPVNNIPIVDSGILKGFDEVVSVREINPFDRYLEK